MRRRSLAVGAGAVLAFLVLVAGAAFFADAPLRRTLERRMNANLKGYTASLGHAHLNPFGLALTLRDVSVSQNANPDPPVLVLPRLKASVHWKELLTLHLVADFLFERPRLNVNRPQLEREANDHVSVKERGWQAALESIYPLKINLLRVEDADVTYVDAASSPPLRIQHLDLRATNIRNLHYKDRVYPSPVEATGVILETGRGTLKGHANFLADPTPGVHALFTLTDVPLTPFRSLVARSNLSVRNGVVSTSGELEIAPGIEFLKIQELAVRKVTIDYLHSAETSGAEKARAETVKGAVARAGKSPETDVRIEKLTVSESVLGFVNRARSPAYRVFLSDAAITATNLSNGLRNGPATVRVTGLFMGTGPAEAHATFRPAPAADFDLSVAIRDTEMKGMNELLRAYGKFDVAAGLFSFFCELHVRNGAVDGYVKPLFRGMKVYDARKDAEKSAFRKLYEKLVGGVAKLLENRERAEVATETRVAGPIDSPKTSTLQIVVRLVENAFFRAILPGFDAELAASKPRREAERQPSR